MTWNTNIEEAPRGKNVLKVRKNKDGEAHYTQFEPDQVLLSTKCGLVMESRWIPRTDKNPGRWLGLAVGEKPVAWMPWPEVFEVK